MLVSKSVMKGFAILDERHLSEETISVWGTKAEQMVCAETFLTALLLVRMLVGYENSRVDGCSHSLATLESKVAGGVPRGRAINPVAIFRWRAVCYSIMGLGRDEGFPQAVSKFQVASKPGCSISWSAC